MPSRTIRSQLLALGNIASPYAFLHAVLSFLTNAAQSLIDTPAERAAIEAEVMAAYDALTTAVGLKSTVLAMFFAASRKTVAAELDRILLALAPAVPPVPA